MRCHDVLQKLDPYCREEIAPSQRRQIDDHLRTCDSCRRELTRIRNLQELMFSDPAPPVPEGFAARVVARAHDESQSVQVVARQASGSRWQSTQLKHRVRVAVVASMALAAGFLLGGFLGLDTYSGDSQSVATGPDLRLFIEPDDNSLAQAYLTLTSDNGFERD